MGIKDTTRVSECESKTIIVYWNCGPKPSIRHKTMYKDIYSTSLEAGILYLNEKRLENRNDIGYYDTSRTYMIVMDKVAWVEFRLD